MENQFLEDRWLSEKQASVYLGISIKTLQKYRLLGEGPRFSRFSKRAIRYHFKTLEEWANARVCESTAQY